MNIQLNEDFKALKRIEKILKQQTKLNNLLIENDRIKDNSRKAISENKILLNILNEVTLTQEQQKQVFNIMLRKVYNA